MLLAQCLGAPLTVIVARHGLSSDAPLARLGAIRTGSDRSPSLPGTLDRWFRRRSAIVSAAGVHVLFPRLRIVASTGAVFVAATMVVAAPLACAVACAFVVGTRRKAAWRLDRDSKRLDRDLVPFVEALARSLRAGVSTLESILEASESFGHHRYFADLAELCQKSASVAQTLELWEGVGPSTSEARRLVQLLQVGESIGGLRPQFVDGVARTLRESAQLASEIRVLSDQARYSALLMSGAPIGFAILLAGTDARAKHFLLETTIGGILIVVGVLLDSAGLWWMHRLVRRVGGV